MKLQDLKRDLVAVLDQIDKNPAAGPALHDELQSLVAQLEAVAASSHQMKRVAPQADDEDFFDNMPV